MIRRKKEKKKKRTSTTTMVVMMRMMKGAATNTDGNDGDNEVKLRTVKTRRGADAGSRTGKAASRMQRCSATTGWKVSSVCLLRSHTHTHERARAHAHMHSTQQADTSIKRCCVQNLTTSFGLHNQKSKSGTTGGLTDSAASLLCNICSNNS